MDKPSYSRIFGLGDWANFVSFFLPSLQPQTSIIRSDDELHKEK